MSNIKRISVIACSALVLISCTKQREIVQNANVEEVKIEEKKMDYIDEYAIKNGLVIDCPKEVKQLRGDVPLGKVSHVSYHSETCKMDRAFSILLPFSYGGEKKYPVVYFQHGIFGDENCMINDPENRFREICAYLAGDGFAKEMIVVFGNMYATTDPNQKPEFKQEAVLPYDNFINELTNDLMPYIESHYAVLTGRENTAVCGFSMGGRESLYIGLQRSDLFGYVGAIAPAPGLVKTKDWAMEHPGMLTENEVKFKDGAELPKLLMVCCGTNDGTVGQYPKSYHNILTNNGVEHLWFEVQAADHNAHAIRSGWFQFVQRVFK